jgi:4-amino-4-deoxy-L-arabinose transferase-like glycosyltransferase
LRLDSLLALLKTKFNKWRLAFLVFAVIYVYFLIVNLSYMSIQWDEANHLNGGLLLLRGQSQSYLESSSFYPPLFDMVTTGFFAVLGVNILSARLVAVFFSLLSLWVVFEFANRLYGPKIALLSTILLGIMPGYVWLSRMALIETMLVFFFTVSMFCFFLWLQGRQNKFLILSGLALGLGVLTKYQMVIAGIVMIASIVVLGRGYLEKLFSKFTLLIVTATAVVIPWIFLAYQIYASGMLNQWLYALQIGNPDKLVYSMRFGPFATPVFYLIEMTWPYNDAHPISLLLYALGLAGLGLMAWRRKPEDKYLLVWFGVVYVFFTVIANKQWRYVLPIFPVLALSGSNLIISALEEAKKTLNIQQISLSKKRKTQVVAGFLIVLTLVGAIYSIYDAYSWVAKDQVRIPIEEATKYAANNIRPDESIMIICAQNFFSQDIARFYLHSDDTKHNAVWQYPEVPVDAFTPNFNITELIGLCKEHNVKYVFTYEYGGDVPYFNTTLNLMEIYMQLYASGKFAYLSGNSLMEDLTREGLIPAFGTNPRRIFVLTFLG